MRLMLIFAALAFTGCANHEVLIAQSEYGGYETELYWTGFYRPHTRPKIVVSRDGEVLRTVYPNGDNE